MAASEGCCESCIASFVTKLSDKEEVKCIGCPELRVELLQAKNEILSLEKIIKMLQEELNMQRTSSNDEFPVQGKLADECSNIQLPQGGWMYSNSKNYKKNYDLNSNLRSLLTSKKMTPWVY
jgi:hypothetical protein